MTKDEEAAKRLADFESQYCSECNTREKWLFKMEVASRLKDVSKLTHFITQYVDFIGHKQCCYVDVERWLPCLQGHAGMVRDEEIMNRMY